MALDEVDPAEKNDVTGSGTGLAHYVEVSLPVEPLVATACAAVARFSALVAGGYARRCKARGSRAGRDDRR